jgi:hypothetical protein
MKCKTRPANEKSKIEIQKSKMPCHGFGTRASRLMSRVKPQKSLGKHELVTVSRVKTPGGVSRLVMVDPLALRAATTTCVNFPSFQRSSMPLWTDPRLSAVIRGNPRLSAV